MKRLLCTTAALSLAFAPVQPWPLMAQDAAPSMAEDGRIVDADGAVLCVPSMAAACDLTAIQQMLADAEASGGAEARAAAVAAMVEATAATGAGANAAAQAEADAAAQAEADAAAQAAIDAAARAEADAAAQAEAAAQAATDAAAQAEAAADATAKADAEAAAQAAADAVSQAEADAAAQAAADAAAQTEADAAAATAAAEGQAAADAAALAAAAATAQAEADAAAAAQAKADADAAVVAAPEPTLVEAPTEAPAETAAEAVEAPVVPISDEAEAALAAAATAEAQSRATAAATAEAPQAEPVDIPVVSEDQVQSLTDLLANPDVMGAAGLGAAAALVDGSLGNAPVETAPADGAQGGPADVTVTTVTEADTRASFEDFADAPQVVEGGKKKSGLSDLEKVGLVALGALVVGAALSGGREVVANTGDRVVVKDDQGGYQVYKDDDTLLRRPGATVRTETYRDGSTRSIVSREDGTEVVTIRDASGRVLRRATYDQTGNEVVLIDDMAPEVKIDVTTLPRPREDRVTISTRDENAALKAALARAEAEQIGRAFSLRQIREIKEVRRLAATIDVENITFETNSAVIRTTEARKLADLGRIIGDILDGSPDELFLTEGHTDAVGSAVSNLTLSDRRAESVALALTEYFGVPPENLVVQGYGESDLRIATEADERLNRRVAVRVVTPLLRTAAR